MNYKKYVEEKKDLPTPYPISTTAKDEKYFDALERYCGNQYNYINSLLRLGRIPNADDNAVKQTEQTIKCLDEIINDAPQENYKILYRVVSKEFYQKLQSESILYEEGYLSASKLKSWAEDQAKIENKVVIKLEVEKEVKRIDVSKIKTEKLSGTEYEVLFQRDTVLRKSKNDKNTFIVSLT